MDWDLSWEEKKDKKGQLHWLPGWHQSWDKQRDAKEMIARNIEGSYDLLDKSCVECRYESLKPIWELNWRLMDAVPEYFEDQNYIMTGPIGLILEHGLKYTISAKAKAFVFEYSTEYMQDSLAVGKKEHELLDWVVGELTTEYKNIKNYEDGKICPYLPVVPIRGIDPNTFMPKIGFKTRYAVFKK